MIKIKDRFILGAIAGLGGNLLKLAIGRTAMKMNLAELGGPERAAGMLVQGHKIATTQGKIVGYVADSVIAGILGVTTVYALSITGKDKAVAKGALSGEAAWTLLYGMLTTMGATKVGPVGPKTVLSELVSHTAYGALTAYLVTKLGAPDLFNGRLPLSASPHSKAAALEQYQQHQQPTRGVQEPDYQNQQQQPQYH